MLYFAIVLISFKISFVLKDNYIILKPTINVKQKYYAVLDVIHPTSEGGA